MSKKSRLHTMAAAFVAAAMLAAMAVTVTGGSAAARALPASAGVSSAGIRAETSASSYGCLAHFAAGNACASLIADASGKYCLSSFGQRGGAVRETECNANSDNQYWYVEGTGANSEFEIWNYGTSCPSGASYSGDECGTPQGMAASKNPNYQNYGFCIGVKGGQIKQNADLVMSACANGQGTSLGNKTFLEPLTFEPVGEGPNSTAFLKFADTKAGAPTLWLSTRGQSKPNAPYVLQEPTKANEKDLEFYGATIGAASNVTGSGPSNPPGAGNSPLQPID